MRRMSGGAEDFLEEASERPRLRRLRPFILSSSEELAANKRGKWTRSSSSDERIDLERKVIKLPASSFPAYVPRVKQTYFSAARINSALTKAIVLYMYAKEPNLVSIAQSIGTALGETEWFRDNFLALLYICRRIWYLNPASADALCATLDELVRLLVSRESSNFKTSRTYGLRGSEQLIRSNIKDNLQYLIGKNADLGAIQLVAWRLIEPHPTLVKDLVYALPKKELMDFNYMLHHVAFVYEVSPLEKHTYFKHGTDLNLQRLVTGIDVPRKRPRSHSKGAAKLSESR